jgi:hypothetical protein
MARLEMARRRKARLSSPEGSQTAKLPPPKGPYSPELARGALARFDARTKHGKYIGHLEAELIKHIGGEPTFPQRLLIAQIIRIQCQINLFSAKIAESEIWTPHDARTYNALLNSFRLTVCALGLKPPKASRQDAFADYWADKATPAPVERVNGAAAHQTASPAKIVLRRPGAAP